jgi:hypothetical protein
MNKYIVKKLLLEAYTKHSTPKMCRMLCDNNEEILNSISVSICDGELCYIKGIRFDASDKEFSKYFYKDEPKKSNFVYFYIKKEYRKYIINLILNNHDSE